MQEKYLIVSDEQIPFHHSKGIEFLRYCKNHFKIPDENCLHVGDELDQFWGGLYKQSADALHTPTSEIKESIDAMKERYALFPKMRVAISNHGTRWARKAFEIGIPQMLMRKYRDVIEAPDTWHWAKKWLVRTKHPFIVEHGDRFGGQYPHVAAAIDNGLSTVIGHHHSIAGVHHIRTQDYHPEFKAGFDIWGAASGCLIDFNAYAFEYAHAARKKPKLGIVIVLDSGAFPIWVPM